MLTSIRWRIALPFVVVIPLIMLGLTLHLSSQVRDAQLADLKAQLAAEARLLAGEITPLLIPGDSSDDLDPLARRWAGLIGARVTIIDAGGTVLGESHADRAAMDNHLSRPEVQQALSTGQGTTIRFSETAGCDMLYVAVPVPSGGQDAGVVRLAVSLEQMRSRVGGLRRAIMGATIPATLLAVLVALYVAERTARPVRRLTRVANRMAEGDLNARLIPSTHDEVGQLTRTFNRMGDRLQEQMMALATERSRLAGVLDHMADGVVITDGQGLVRLLNPAAARLLEARLEDALGRSVAQVMRHYQFVELWQRATRSGEEQVEAVEIDRQGLFLQVIVTPLADADREGYLIILQDLTRIRRLETVRRDFVSNISHELRTPLASLKALVETLRDGAQDDPPAAQRFLDRMDAEVDALTQMVQELLELARIESGQVPLLLQPVPLATVVIPAVERMQAQAERANLVLTVEPLPDVTVLTDAERARQVITNLVHNAIKFTPAGGRVTVSASAEADEVLVSVRDTGIGIPAADLPRIFERFYKARRTRSDGTGLGLAIARHIVQAHSGRIWAESVEGRGSSFTFTLPYAEGGGRKPG